jgi:hypothetical protein
LRERTDAGGEFALFGGYIGNAVLQCGHTLGVAPRSRRLGAIDRRCRSLQRDDRDGCGLAYGQRRQRAEPKRADERCSNRKFGDMSHGVTLAAG